MPNHENSTGKDPGVAPPATSAAVDAVADRFWIANVALELDELGRRIRETASTLAQTGGPPGESSGPRSANGYLTAAGFLRDLAPMPTKIADELEEIASAELRR